MADLTPVTLPVGEVTLVCSNVTSGIMHNLIQNRTYLCYHVDTGESAPSVATMQSDGFYVFVTDKITEEIKFDNAADIYLLSEYNDGKVIYISK